MSAYAVFDNSCYSLSEPKVLPLEEETFSAMGPEGIEVFQRVVESYGHFTYPMSRVGPLGRFITLQLSWKHEKRFSSSLTEVVLNKNYQQIIGMGPCAVPLILRSLQEEPDYWFHALSSITGENPIPANATGDLVAMTRAWLEWGHQKGYIKRAL